MSDVDLPEAWDPKRIRQRFQDIARYGNAVKALLEPLTPEQFLHDETIQKAACFDLLCISEATAQLLRLDPTLEERYPILPWHQIRAIANVLRHSYGRIDIAVVWDTVRNGDIDRLLAVIETESTGAASLDPGVSSSREDPS